MKDLFTQLGEGMVRNGIIVHIPHTCDIYLATRIKKKSRVVEDQLIVDHTKMNYGGSRKLWKTLYPDKTWEEIRKIPNKPRIFYKDYDSDVTHYFFIEKVANSVIPQLYRIRLNRTITRKVKTIKTEMGEKFPVTFGKRIAYHGIY